MVIEFTDEQKAYIEKVASKVGDVVSERLKEDIAKAVENHALACENKRLKEEKDTAKTETATGGISAKMATTLSVIVSALVGGVIEAIRKCF